MYVDYEDALEFMFNINKQGRKLLINNGFMNDGLIDICFSDEPDEKFNNYDLFEKHYLLALKRNVCNRILTFNLKYIDEYQFKILKKIINWITD